MKFMNPPVHGENFAGRFAAIFFKKLPVKTHNSRSMMNPPATIFRMRNPEPTRSRSIFSGRFAAVFLKSPVKNA